MGRRSGQLLSGRGLAIFILSLLLSFAVWLIHNLSLNYGEVVSVPVVAQCNIPGHAYRSASAALVKAECRSTGFRLLRLSSRSENPPVGVTFSAQDLHPMGGDLFYTTATGLKNYVSEIFGEEVSVESFLSDTLIFRFPYEDSRLLPVEGVIQVSCSPQYVQTGPVEFSPDSVTVFGDPDILSSIGSVKTEAINVEGVKSRVFSKVALKPVQGLRYSQERVDYSFDVARYVEIVKEVPVGTRNVPAGKKLIVYPSVARLVMRCRFPVSEQTGVPELYVDYNDFNSSLKGQCMPRSGALPDGVISFGVEPEVFDCVEVSLW